mmetsp:Transcript_1731/g.5438  ORF Transcript_1731/g.5438 Transcript_1731/m.5438 type:complete len:273 (+) Transcript_1731:196-1014(+)
MPSQCSSEEKHRPTPVSMHATWASPPARPHPGRSARHTSMPAGQRQQSPRGGPQAAPLAAAAAAPSSGGSRARQVSVKARACCRSFARTSWRRFCRWAAAAWARSTSLKLRHIVTRPAPASATMPVPFLSPGVARKASCSVLGSLRSVSDCTCQMGRTVFATAHPGAARSGCTNRSQWSWSRRYRVHLPFGDATPHTIRSTVPMSKEVPSLMDPTAGSSICRGGGSLPGPAQCPASESAASGLCCSRAVSKRRRSRKAPRTLRALSSPVHGA